MDQITFVQVGTGRKMMISIVELADEAKEILEWGYGKSAKTYFLDSVIFGQRLGQAFMNTLRNHDLSEYARLSRTLVDPFYDDTKLLAAIDMLTSK
jgi:hypothetical protein